MPATATPSLSVSTPAGRTVAVGDLLDYHAEWDAHRCCGAVAYAGYAIVRTIDADGVVLVADGGLGPVVAVVEGGHRYADTFALRDALRSGKGWAVVASVYECGHAIW